MVKKLVSGVIGTQEMFEFEERISVSREYVPSEAREMALHRRKRIGHLALTEPTFGFRAATNGLWVPHSQTENMAVTRHPVPFIKQNALMIRDKVFEKHTDDEGELKATIGRIASWAHFAELGMESDIANKFDGWRDDGRKKYFAMNRGLDFDGNVLRQDVEENPEILASIASYMADLKSYIGHPDTMRGVKRYWMRDNAVRQQAVNLAETTAFMRTQPDWEFDRWFAESWYNHRSRAKFWYDVIHSHTKIRMDIVAKKQRDRWRDDMIRRGYDV